MVTDHPQLPIREPTAHNLATLRTLLESGAWDTLIAGGEEADIDIFYQQEAPVFVPANAPATGNADPRTRPLLDPA